MTERTPPALVLLAVAALAGCAGIGSLATSTVDRGYGRVADALDEYCALPRDRRELIRGRISRQTGNQIVVTCYDDQTQ